MVRNISNVTMGLLIFLLSFCTDSEMDFLEIREDTIENQESTIRGCTNPLSPNYNPNATIDDGSCEGSCSSCDFVVSETQGIFDGNQLGVQPGDIICLDANKTYSQPINFKYVKGTAENPVIITNCGGQALVSNSGGSYVMKTHDSQYIRITGTGYAGEEYGIKLSGSQGNGLSMDYLSSNFEIDHIEVENTGFAGIMAKTNPTCIEATWRENFTMMDISIHDNYIHDTHGEGMYIGHTTYGGVPLDCGRKLPHHIVNAEIYNNIVENSGWDGIQFSTVISGGRVHDNVIKNYGTANNSIQNNGLIIGGGSTGLYYNNQIINGTGNGIATFGLGDATIFNNLIVDAGDNGMFIDTRYTPIGDGYNVINNTIINSSNIGISFQAIDLNSNKSYNNIIVSPGGSFISTLAHNVEELGNYFNTDINALNFSNPGVNDYQLLEGSPAIDIGIDVMEYNINITFDILNNPRPVNNIYDAGAYEKQ